MTLTEIILTGFLFTIVSPFLLGRKKTIVRNSAEYGEYLKSPHWCKVKKHIRKLFNYKCAHCGAKMKDGGFFDVHHKTYKRLGRERLGFKLFFYIIVVGDLLLLCRKCHRKVDHSKIK